MKGAIGTSIKPKTMAKHPNFPVGTRPANVYGPHINQHPKPVQAPSLGGPAAPSGPRQYGKAGFNPFGAL